jgi:glycosyltransferase involved in cell wall biosynthesis
MTRPAVSVILPTHQRPAMLARAVASVLAQTWRDWELIVIENGGGAAADVLAQLPSDRIRLVTLPHPNVSVARNRGLELAAGRYVAFLDDDDEWLPEKLERQLR